MQRTFELKKIDDLKAEVKQRVSKETTVFLTLAQVIEKRNQLIQDKIILEASTKEQFDRLTEDINYFNSLIEKMKEIGIKKPEKK